jgi:hypothetical protein
MVMLPLLISFLFILSLLLSLPAYIAFSTPSNGNNVLQMGDNTTANSREQENLIPYTSPTYGIRIDYPPNWKPIERQNNGYHMLNVVVEFLQPQQNNYYNSTISASHNSLRLSVEDYKSFTEKINGNTMDNQLQIIGNKRIGSIGISCPGFDLKNYLRNATLASNPAYEIGFDYSYLNNNKKAIEIWTIHENKVYIINYVANEAIYDTTLPLVQKMIESFKITT